MTLAFLVLSATQASILMKLSHPRTLTMVLAFSCSGMSRSTHQAHVAHASDPETSERGSMRCRRKGVEAVANPPFSNSKAKLQVSEKTAQAAFRLVCSLQPRVADHISCRPSRYQCWETPREYRPNMCSLVAKWVLPTATCASVAKHFGAMGSSKCALAVH